ncbi:hypothetical protein GCM10010207_10860 [Streptomyces atratus]|nr:hypothetical protein GCM10010207_10860 [Streptomyces atratus]
MSAMAEEGSGSWAAGLHPAQDVLSGRVGHGCLSGESADSALVYLARTGVGRVVMEGSPPCPLRKASDART